MARNIVTFLSAIPWGTTAMVIVGVVTLVLVCLTWRLQKRSVRLQEKRLKPHVHLVIPDRIELPFTKGWAGDLGAPYLESTWSVLLVNDSDGPILIESTDALRLPTVTGLSHSKVRIEPFIGEYIQWDACLQERPRPPVSVSHWCRYFVTLRGERATLPDEPMEVTFTLAVGYKYRNKQYTVMGEGTVRINPVKI